MASIDRRPDGRYRARYRDRDGVQHARHFGRKTDARRWLDEVTADVVTGRYVDPGAGRVTLATFYVGWSARQLWAPGTRAAYDLALRTAPTVADVPLRNLRRSHIETMVKTWESDGLAPGTIRTRFSNIHSVLRAAVRDRIIATDPSDGVTLPRVRRAAQALTIPTTGQVGALLRAVDPTFRAGVALAGFGGLRLGEVCGVQLGDINFLGRTLHVARQIQRVPGGRVDVRAPKHGGERAVYLPDDLVTILAEHVRRVGPDPWLFATADGRPFHQDDAGHLWERARHRAGVSGVRFHDLRHFYASGLIHSGCDVVTVQRALGHSSASITLNTYAHLWPTAEDRTRAAAAGLLATALADVEDSVRTGRP